MKIYPYTPVSQIGHKASIGLIALSTDETIEYELSEWLKAEGIALYVSRIAMAEENTPEALKAMKDKITQSASLLPNRISYQALGYACTSASALIGHDAVDALLAQGAKAEHYTNPLKAFEAYCEEYHIKRIDLLTPYQLSTLKGLTDKIGQAGIEILHMGSFNEIDDAQVARIDPQSIYEAALDLAQHSKSDALFMSCTNLRTKEIIAPLSKALNRPVISSNQLMAWHLRRLAGL